MISDDALARRDDQEQMGKAMERLSEWLKQAAQEGRAVLNSLRTSTKTTDDLANAFERALHESFVPASMKTSLIVTGEARELHPIVRDEIYCIVREAIRNVCYHSAATDLLVEMEYGRQLTIWVRDNGVGMTQHTLTQGKAEHFGMAGMRERAHKIRADIQFVSHQGTGTTVTIKIKGPTSYITESARASKRA